MLRGLAQQVLSRLPPGTLAVLRPLPLVLFIALLLELHAVAPPAARAEPDLSRALSRALEVEGVHAEPLEIYWLDRPAGVIGSRRHRPRALLRGTHDNEPSDIYLVNVRLSPEGRLLEITGLYNLSDTSAVDEQKLIVAGERVAWTISGGGRSYSVQYADLRGEQAPRDWTRLQRFQNALTNAQQTGQTAGVGRRSFRLEPAAARLVLGFADDALLIDADGRRIRVPTESDRAIEGERFITEQTPEKARPGNLVTWAVDRTRALPWFGSDRMQAVKAIAFTGLDWLERAAHSIWGDDGQKRVAEELPGLLDTPPIAYTDPETGWPPPPMQPMLSPALEGEGKWVPLDKDPFVLKNPGAAAPFALSFVRVDRKRAYAQTYVLLWDPRQVRLSAMSGTQEPKSATGETGPGRVPRKPEVMGRLLAGFNGGFQATHGEFGMMAESVVYLPPKPFAATVAELADGSTGFGTWPRDDSVPDGFISFRQNMTPLVVDEVVNPYKRSWWGGVPPGWTDEARTVRSALCLTKENFVAYLYGSSLDADTLALAMQRARCVYGIHLDMNPGHTGLELYRAAPKGGLPDVGHALDPQWEARGSVEGMPGWEFMGRRMIRYMGLMNFPRYVGRESRDFFYLTLRHVLPSESVATSATREAGEGEWLVKGLPQHGWPYAIATTGLRPEASRPETKVLLVEIDPHAVRIARDAEREKLVVELHEAKTEPGDGAALWLSRQGFTIARQPPEEGAQRIGVPVAKPGQAFAAIGVRETSRTLLYAEVATAARPAADAPMLDSLLARLGCGSRLLLERPLGVALGGERDLSGHPVQRGKRGIALVRAEAPGARRIFSDTPVVKPDEWFPLQARRVRYFRKPDAPSSSSGAAGSLPAPAAPETAPPAQ